MKSITFIFFFTAIVCSGCTTINSYIKPKETFVDTCIRKTKVRLEKKGLVTLKSEESIRKSCLCLLDQYKKPENSAEYIRAYINAGIESEFMEEEIISFNSQAETRCSLEGLKTLGNKLKGLRDALKDVVSE